MGSNDWPDTLFSPEAKQWGLRGDPYLWSELREALRGQQEPPTPEAFRAVIMDTLESLLGCQIEADIDVYVERFAHGGMSSGQVSGVWWVGTGIPLLVDRFIGWKA